MGGSNKIVRRYSSNGSYYSLGFIMGKERGRVNLLVARTGKKFIVGLGEEERHKRILSDEQD